MSLDFGRSRKLPVFLQAEGSECGLVCINMIAAYFGHKTDMVSLRERFGISTLGATLRTLMSIGDHMGMSTRALRIELDEIKELKCPAILHWTLDHYVVLKKVTSSGIIVHDPAVGVRSYSLEEVGHRLTGIALEFSPRNEFESGDFAKKLSIGEFWKGAKGLGSSLIQVLVLSLLIQIFTLAIPLYMQIVVDDVLVKNDVDLLIVLALGFVFLTLLSVVSKSLREFSNLYLVNQLSYNIGDSVMHHLIRLPLQYFEKRHMGDVISRFRSIQPIQNFITSSAITIIIDGLLSTFTLVLIFVYSPSLAVIVIIASSLYALFRLLQFQPLRNANSEHISAAAKLDSNFLESIRNLQGIKLAGRESERQGTWRNKFVDTINTNAKIGRLTIYFEAARSTLTGLEHVMIIYFGAHQVLSGEITIGMLYAFMAYRSHFSNATISLVNQYIQYRMISLHLERVSDITHTSKEMGLECDSRLILPIRGNLSLTNSSFSYSTTDKDILLDLSLDIIAGEFVAIFGPSGIGKTTLIKILMGLVQPTSGRLTIDGHSLDLIGIKSYRNSIAAVMQDDSLFNGSLKENIAFFDLSPNIKKIVEAAKLACIDEDIMATPMGYDSLIGDMGSSLSKGQMQRVLLARALYTNPKILFLDEGTAHVDVETEKEILHNLKGLDLTCVYITHNPDLLQFAEMVVEWSSSSSLPEIKRIINDSQTKQ